MIRPGTPRLAAIALLAHPLLAGDGIWLFNQPPVERVRKEHGFNLTGPFLDRLRSASVRVGAGGSGSFVSPRGLVFTNHHVASECIQKVSSKEHDYMKNGFLAATHAEEKRCPGEEVTVLQEIRDVTSAVNEGTKPDDATPAANQRRKANQSALEKECTAANPGGVCQTVTLYSGGLYHLYRYKKYDEVRLVFAPEDAIAAFGGDPDNFMFPRYCLDFAFLRVYEHGKPASTPNHLVWSKSGAREGELTFVSGHPASTGRLATMAELEFLRDHLYPVQIANLQTLNDMLIRFGGESAENKRLARDVLTTLQNSFKAYTGFLAGLRDAALMNRKRDEQQTLRAGVAKDPAAGARFDETLAKIDAAYREYARIFLDYYFFESRPARGSELFGLSRQVLRYGAEKAKPNDQRLREYSESELPRMKQLIGADAPLSAAMETELLAVYFDALGKAFGPGDARVKAILGGRSAKAAAAAYVESSAMTRPSERVRLAEDASAAQSSADGMLTLARRIDVEGRRARAAYEDKVEAVVRGAASEIAKARFALYGTNAYPDATFTLRLSYGPVIGYTGADGKPVRWATDFAGLYARATGEEPFALPERWKQARSALKLSTPFNFVTTADTHGGNSGSPTVNRRGEVNGILFDGNLEGLPNRFVYRDKTERSVHVASQGIVEALRKVYQAGALLRELGVAQ